MSTIPMLPDDEIPESARELVARILAREQRVFGATSLSNVWRCQVRHPEYMHANWARSRALMQRGDVPPVTKEMVASAVSMINACEY
ncbi:MAG: carboxymuconolactone decarboxylase family protein [Rhodospirillales bacterium]|nr:carboxymuconolactone decarboxylase family protein [Rhodospirillales bacterium]